MFNKVLIIMLLLSLLILTGCMAGTGSNTPDNKAGFLMGIWHGWIAPFSLITSLFNENVSIYEINNNGFWYELGFYMAIISGFGGLSIIRKQKKS